MWQDHALHVTFILVALQFIAVRALSLACKLPAEKLPVVCIFPRKVVVQNCKFTFVVYSKV